MYKIYFKNVNNIIIYEGSSVKYSKKDNCMYIEYNGVTYKCSMTEAEADSYLISGIKNDYIYFKDKIFSMT